MAEQRTQRFRPPEGWITIPSRAQEERGEIRMEEAHEPALTEAQRSRLRNALIAQGLPEKVADAIQGFLAWETLASGHHSLELRVRGALSEDEMRKCVRAFTRVFGETHEVSRRGSTITLTTKSWEPSPESTISVALEPTGRGRAARAREEEAAPTIRATETRTKQILRALETGDYAGITYPAPRGKRAEFFEQFTEEEMRYITLAWGMATQEERELFAAELDAYFKQAGPGRIGMETLVLLLKGMAQDSISQKKYISLIDLYYYITDVMAEENIRGTRRRSKIGGSIARAMERSVGTKYNELTMKMEELRRAAIRRELSLEGAVPAPVEEAAAAPAEAAEEAVPVPVQEVPAGAVPAGAVPTRRAVYDYSWAVQQRRRLERGEISSPRELRAILAGLDEVMRREAGSPERTRFLLGFRGAITRALTPRAAPRVAEEAAPPVEEAPAEEAAPAVPAAPVEEVAYDFAWADAMLARILELSEGRMLDDRAILSVPGMEDFYRELYAHIDEAIENTADAEQRDSLIRVRDLILAPVLGA